MKAKLILITILLQFAVVQLNAQDDKNSPKEKNFGEGIVSIDFGRLFIKELRLSYEHPISKKSGGLFTAAYLFATSNSYSNEQMWYFPLYWNVFNGVYLSYGYIYNGKNEYGFYHGLNVSYFLKFFEKKFYEDFTGSDWNSYVYLESIYRNKFGAEYLFGFKKLMHQGEKVSFAIDVSMGLGVQYRFERKQIWGVSWDHYYFDFDNYRSYGSEYYEREKKFLPLVNLNLKYSFTFKHQ